MKKIICGKVYDTNTAKVLGDWSNGGSWRDFGHVVETLYKKKTGEFFLHGEGGAASKYAVSEGPNSWTGGERIMPMTFEEAREWAEEKLTADEYEGIFGKVEEDDSKTLISAYIRKDTAEKLKRIASETGCSQSELLQRLIDYSCQPGIFTAVVHGMKK